MAQADWACTLDDLARATGGTIRSRVAETFSRVGTDSRKNLAGRLFIPLHGENFDAHNFVAPAVECGAVAVLVSEWRSEWEPLLKRASFVEVTDTLKALQDLAHAWRRKHAFKVLAITGSNGKTSTKEFLSSILGDHLAVHASRGSFNNHWGVPLSILEADPSLRHLILEMGMNHAGEIRRLCEIAEPDIVTVTTVGRAHIGELGSAQAVAKAKEEIYIAAPNAIHVFNGDNEWTIPMRERSHAKQIVFSSFNSRVDVSLRATRLTWEGLEIVGRIGESAERKVWVRTLGRHNVVNLMAASALALAAGLTSDQIWSSLEKIHDVAWGRNQPLRLTNGTRVLWDGYNANPDSMGALIKNVFEMDVRGRKFLVVGDMRELGEFAEEAHRDLGAAAADLHFEAIWYIGQYAQAFGDGLRKHQPETTFIATPDVSPEKAKEFLARLGSEDMVAVKASRGVALERVFADWPFEVGPGRSLRAKAEVLLRGLEFRFGLPPTG